MQKINRTLWLSLKARWGAEIKSYHKGLKAADIKGNGKTREEKYNRKKN